MRSLLAGSAGRRTALPALGPPSLARPRTSSHIARYPIYSLSSIPTYGSDTLRLMKPEAQALKGHLDVLLLATLEDGPRHGYAVKEALREGSDGRFDLPTGTIYPALHRLEQAGLITSSWSTVDGRRRRTYRLTAQGLRRLHADRNNWHGFAAAVTALLERGPWPATN